MLLPRIQTVYIFVFKNTKIGPKWWVKQYEYLHFTFLQFYAHQVGFNIISGLLELTLWCCQTQLHLWRVWYFSFSFSYLVSGIVSFQFDNQCPLTAKLNLIVEKWFASNVLQPSFFDTLIWAWQSSILRDAEGEIPHELVGSVPWYLCFDRGLHPWINAYHMAGAVQKTVLTGHKTAHNFHYSSEFWIIALMWEKTNIKRKNQVIYVAVATSFLWL